MANRNETVLALDQVVKEYRLGSNVVRALNGVNLTVDHSQMVAVVGPSGSGKSTLLNILGAMDRPDRGQVVIEGTDLDSLSERDLTAYRRQKVGFVFQTFELIPNLSALENVMLPMEFNGMPAKKRAARARKLLEAVLLEPRADHRPGRLSGGEQQRVAIARALANDPAIILADEPTGNLDTATGIEIVGLLRRFVTGEGKTVIVVTHDETMAQLADVRVHLRDGVIVETARAGRE